MKIPTKDLTGLALDWAVAKALRLDFIPKSGVDGIGKEFTATRFSSDYSFGGPLMNEYGVGTLYDSGSAARKPSWFATSEDQSPRSSYEGECFEPAFMVDESSGIRGETQLIAAMRCIVLARLGDLVEVPPEFIK